MKLIRNKLALTPFPGAVRTVMIARLDTEKALIIDKILEEALEIFNARSVEEIKQEMADLEEVLSHAKKLHNISQAEIDKIRMEKNEARGTFDGGFILV